MSTTIRLADATDAERLVTLMAQDAAEQGQAFDAARRTRAIQPLLDGSPHGAVWLMGPARAPLGYVTVSFGWSVDLGGMEGWLSHVYVRASVRQRGIGTEVVNAVAVSLAQSGGVRALHARIDSGDARAARLCARTGFRAQTALTVQSQRL